MLALAVLIPVALVPAAYGAYLYFRIRIERPPEIEAPAEPSVYQHEFQGYDLAALRPGDWIEHEVLTASPFDGGAFVRTRLACVEADERTVWIEGRDHLVARFFPGTIVLYALDRATGVVREAWWGPEGGVGRPVSIDRRVTGSQAAVVEWRGQAIPEDMAFGDRTLGCQRVLCRVRSAGGEFSASSVAWLCPDVPFRRRACLSIDDTKVRWDTPPPAPGGLVRETYSGLTVKMVVRVVAWGKGAVRSLQTP